MVLIRTWRCELPEQGSGNLKVPFGLREGRLYRPDDVSSGKACGCICPACEATLIANQGKLKRAYFSHFRTETCAGGYETAVHLMAKQVILDERRLRTPPLTIPFELTPIEDEPPIRSSLIFSTTVRKLIPMVLTLSLESFQP